MNKEIADRYRQCAKEYARFRVKITAGELMEKALLRYLSRKETKLHWVKWRHQNFDKVYERDGGRCLWCHRELTKKEATLDHILPSCRGGKTKLSNVSICCEQCNNDKDVLTAEEYMFKLGYFGNNTL